MDCSLTTHGRQVCPLKVIRKGEGDGLICPTRPAQSTLTWTISILSKFKLDPRRQSKRPLIWPTCLAKQIPNNFTILNIISLFFCLLSFMQFCKTAPSHSRTSLFRPSSNGRMALLYIYSSFSSFLPSTCLTNITSHLFWGMTFLHKCWTFVHNYRSHRRNFWNRLNQCFSCASGPSKC